MKKFFVRHLISTAIMVLFAALAFHYGDGRITLLGLIPAVPLFFLEWLWFKPSTHKFVSILGSPHRRSLEDWD